MLGKAFKKVSKAIKKQLCQASFPNGFCKYIASHGTYYNHERSREEQRLSLPPSLASSKKILSIYSTHNQLSFLSFLIPYLLENNPRISFFFLPKIADYIRVRITFECGFHFFFQTRKKCLFVNHKKVVIFKMMIIC